MDKLTSSRLREPCTRALFEAYGLTEGMKSAIIESTLPPR